MASLKEQREIDRIYNALRPRLKLGGGSGGGSTTIPAHKHPATDITVSPAGDIASTDAQAAIEELDTEKLPIDGHRAMEGNLDLGHYNIANINDAEVEHNLTVGNDVDIQQNVNVWHGWLDVLDNDIYIGDYATNFGDLWFFSPEGKSNIYNVRKIHLIGTEAAGEGRIDGANAAVFNPAAPAPEAGRLSYDNVEKTLVFFVESGV